MFQLKTFGVERVDLLPVYKPDRCRAGSDPQGSLRRGSGVSRRAAPVERVAIDAVRRRGDPFGKVGPAAPAAAAGP
jgi:hypothetical protein